MIQLTIFKALYNVFNPFWWIDVTFRVGKYPLLLANAVFILDENRFLDRIGWLRCDPPSPQLHARFDEKTSTPLLSKDSVILVLNRYRKLVRVILIPLNLIAIIGLLVSG